MSERVEASVPADVHETVMEATYRALCANGFASLTMQDIADEADKSTSLLHYHYDTKRDLLVAFLRYLIERFKERFEDAENEDPEERLRGFVSRMVPDGDGADDYDRFGLAIMELRMRAPYEEAYREQLRTNEAVIRARLADIVRDGIEEGVFREVDPDRTARLVFDALDGARSERVTVGADEAPAEVAAALDEFVLSTLVIAADEADEGGETE